MGIMANRRQKSLREIAKEFCVDVEDLLGMVLQYRIDMDRLKGKVS